MLPAVSQMAFAVATNCNILWSLPIVGPTHYKYWRGPGPLGPSMIDASAGGPHGLPYRQGRGQSSHPLPPTILRRERNSSGHRPGRGKTRGSSSPLLGVAIVTEVHRSIVSDRKLNRPTSPFERGPGRGGAGGGGFRRT